METIKLRPQLYRCHDYLKQNAIGKGKSIPAKDLANYFDITDRTLREWINEMRKSSIFDTVICSGDTGYWLASTEDEVNETVERLFSCATEQIKIAQKLCNQLSKNNQMQMNLGNKWKEFKEVLAKEL